MLEEDHRVVAADGGRQHADDVGGCRRCGDLQAGDGQGPVLGGLGVLGAEAEAAAVGGAHHEWDGDLTARHIACLGYPVGEVVPATGREAGEHDLDDRAGPGHRGTHRRAHDGLFGDRRVPHPFRPELLEQSGGRPEHSPGLGDVPADADHGRIAPHLPGQPLRDRLAIGDHVRHAAPPSAHTSVSAPAGSGPGARSAASTARATVRSTRASTSGVDSPREGRRGRAPGSGVAASG